MSLNIARIGSIIVVSPEGQINSANAAAIEAELIALVDAGQRQAVLDLSRLNYLSSAGLRVILVLAKRLKQQDGALVLCGMSSQVREVFDVSGFLAILAVTDTREQAIARLSAH
ncbi:STAS domain-containing protein [Achromobacter aloeverae]|uniref:Anti-sigma factor antagonist n=1 Tax=Achromobacter aloeverae TaxID=1750518 RepID=A0A4Q1HEM9_9BURK|nr:STAS domain-containing protein [Achromobacter aloeverae]RXN84631.1 anti-sigma factor antagonist [Achromobacter aloeverae]